MTRRLLASMLLLLGANAAPTSAQSLDLGSDNAGLSIGNSPRWNGLRLNWRDEHVDYVNGINITIWTARENPDFDMNGLALGILGPDVERMRGLGVGLGGTVAHESLSGIGLGGLAVVTGGRLSGIGIGGLATVTNGRLRGLGIGGLATVTNGGIEGIGIGGLATVGNGDATGFTAGGLASVADGSVQGITVGGLAAVANGGLTGLGIGGLAVVTQGRIAGIAAGGLATVANAGIRGIAAGGLAVVSSRDIEGIAAGGLAVVGAEGVRGIAVGGLAVVGGTGPVEWVALSLGAVESVERISGLATGAYRIRAPRMEGAAIGLVMSRFEDLDGFAVAGYNEVRGVQRGLTIGLYNRAEELNGVQIGLLNYAANARFRWLPIINWAF